MPRYAVVCESALMHQGKMQFSVWHDTLDLARYEAERLCKKEQKEFIILKEVAKVKLQTTPVVWETME